MCEMISSIVVIVVIGRQRHSRRVVIVMCEMMHTLSPHGRTGGVGRRVRQMGAHVGIARGAGLCLRGDLGIVGVVVTRLNGALKVGQAVEGAGEIVTAIVMQTGLSAHGGEDDDGYFGAAQNGQLARLLQQPVAPLGERDLAVALVLDVANIDLAAAHSDGGSGRGCWGMAVTARVGAAFAREGGKKRELE